MEALCGQSNDTKTNRRCKKMEGNVLRESLRRRGIAAVRAGRKVKGRSGRVREKIEKRNGGSKNDRELREVREARERKRSPREIEGKRNDAWEAQQQRMYWPSHQTGANREREPLHPGKGGVDYGRREHTRGGAGSRKRACPRGRGGRGG